MQIREIEKRELLLIQNLTALWERSVIATHLFLNARRNRANKAIFAAGA